MILNELFQEVQKNVNFFVNNINQDDAKKIFNHLNGCKGIIFFTGIGKSALIAKKTAVTMTSTGTRSLFISPIDALHGDIGLIGKEDILAIFSKSGETEELLNLIPYARNKGASIVSITNNSRCRLAKAADYAITLPIEKELCAFNLVPTTSTIVQAIFGDALAIGIMTERKFTLDDYAMNHPSGSIGKRMLLKVNDLMLSGQAVPKAKPQDKLIDTLVELSDKKAGCVLIVDEANRLLGIFTDGDLRRSLQRLGADVLQYDMKDLMNTSCKTTHPENLAWDAMKVMEGDQKSPIMVLPVIDDKQNVVGLIKMHDIVQSGL